ncbi:mevalonate kinase [Bifidobacterium sp.]|uniref:mevalonate kinase n=1 Tax=Bifidobacterium sp. TaxID=41200 RepID=UPI0039EBD64C
MKERTYEQFRRRPQSALLGVENAAPFSERVMRSASPRLASRTSQMELPSRGAFHSGYGETWAKAILVGEHSAVYGYPAVALPLHSMKMKAWATPNLVGRHQLRALGFTGPLDDSGDRFAGIRRAVSVAEEFVSPQRWSAFTLVTEADFPAERGLGSSAAAAGAVIRAVLDAYGVGATSQELFELTNRAEMVTHGHPSGLDSATTCSQNAVVLSGGRISHVSMKASGVLVIADSGICGSTREAVGNVHHQYETDRPRIEAILGELGTLGSQSVDDLQGGKMDDLGVHMNAAHILLAQLKVSEPTLDRLVNVARDAGALGAKLTGGGLGGCIVALAADQRHADVIMDELRQAGACGVWSHGLGALA